MDDPQDDPVLQLSTNNCTGAYENLSFLMKFPNGSFKNAVIMLKDHSGVEKTGNFTFFKEGVTYQRWDDGEAVFNYMELRASEMLSYKYYSHDDIPADLVSHEVGINFVDLCNRIKSAKNDGAKIYKVKTDDPRSSEAIHVKTINSSGESGNIRAFQPRTLKHQNYDIESIEKQFGFSSEPDIKVTTVKFKNMITSMNNTGSMSIRITRRKNGITWRGIGPDGGTISVDPWIDICEISPKEVSPTEITPNTLRFLDDVDDDMLESALGSAVVSYAEKEEDFKVELIAQTMRSFTKYHAFNNAGIIKIFMGKDAIKFEGAIDACGSMTTIVRSNVPT